MPTVGVNVGTWAAVILDLALALATVAMRLAYLKAPTTSTASVTTTINAPATLNAPLPPPPRLRLLRLLALPSSHWCDAMQCNAIKWSQPAAGFFCVVTTTNKQDHYICTPNCPSLNLYRHVILISKLAKLPGFAATYCSATPKSNKDENEWRKHRSKERIGARRNRQV